MLCIPRMGQAEQNVTPDGSNNLEKAKFSSFFLIFDVSFHITYFLD